MEKRPHIISSSPGADALSDNTPVKKRGLCLQAGVYRHPCRDCEECVWIDQVPMDKDYRDIVSIHAASGCQGGGGVEFKLDLPEGRGTWRRFRCWDAARGSHEAPLEEKTIFMDSAGLSGFIDGLQDCGLLYWGERYELDEGEGSEWVIRIEFDGFRVKKSGQNSFPRKWESWCRLLNDCLQVEFR